MLQLKANLHSTDLTAVDFSNSRSMSSLHSLNSLHILGIKFVAHKFI